MVQSEHFAGEQPLDEKKFREILQTKIAGLDVEKAKSDVKPFVEDQASLDLWSRDFFHAVAEKLRIDSKQKPALRLPIRNPSKSRGLSMTLSAP